MRLIEFADPNPPLAPSGLGSVLERTAKASGIVGTELAQLLAQCHVETMGFQTLKELPNKWQQHYEPPSRTAQILGNKYQGDGQRFTGRGFIQVTGRYNYTQFAQNSGIDVVKNPQWLEDPNTAAKATVDYWLTRVRPYVKDFTNTAQVTPLINHAKKGASERIAAFKQYVGKLPQQPKKQVTAKTTSPQVPKTTAAKPAVQTKAQTPAPKQKDDIGALLKLKGLG